MEDLFWFVMKKRRRFIVISIIAIFFFYFSFPLASLFFPKFLKNEINNFQLYFTWGYAFFQFFITWFIGWLYTRKAKQWDQILKQMKQEEKR